MEFTDVVFTTLTFKVTCRYQSLDRWNRYVGFFIIDPLWPIRLFYGFVLLQTLGIVGGTLLMVAHAHTQLSIKPYKKICGSWKLCYKFDKDKLLHKLAHSRRTKGCTDERSVNLILCPMLCITLNRQFSEVWCSWKFVTPENNFLVQQ